MNSGEDYYMIFDEIEYSRISKGGLRNFQALVNMAPKVMTSL